MKVLFPILAMIGTALATLTALVFCMAMGANSTAAQVRALKFWMAGLSLLGATGIVAGVILIRAGQPNWAAAAAFAPTILYSIILGISLLK